MAGDSPLPALLERASSVFMLAGKLGRAFQAEHEERRGNTGHKEAGGWSRHKPAFDEFCTALADLRPAVQQPSADFAPVAKVVMVAAAKAKALRDAMRKPEGHASGAYLDFFPDLNTFFEQGLRAVKAARETLPPDDPLAFVNESASVTLPAKGSVPEPAAAAVDDPATVLESIAKQRADQKTAAAERGWADMQRRDKLECVWDTIYVFAPLNGEPEDYQRWAGNLVRFAEAAVETGFADRFREAQVTDDVDQRNALSLVQAAMNGGRDATLRRLAELDGVHDDRGWKRVFNESILFSRIMSAVPQPEPVGEPPGAASPMLSKEPAVQIDSTPALPRPPDRFVDAARRDIPLILANVVPAHDGTIELIASHLTKRLQDAQHTLAAAHWAVHDSILAGLLQPGPVKVGLPVFFRMVKGHLIESGPGEATLVVPQDGPAPFDTFLVRATEALWDWWRSLQDADDGAVSSADGPTSGGTTGKDKKNGSAAAAARRGRRKADYETEQREAQIADDWARAKGAGIYKVDFARGIGLTAAKLDTLLDRVAKRKERASDK